MSIPPRSIHLPAAGCDMAGSGHYWLINRRFGYKLSTTWGTDADKRHVRTRKRDQDTAAPEFTTYSYITFQFWSSIFVSSLLHTVSPFHTKSLAHAVPYIDKNTRIFTTSRSRACGHRGYSLRAEGEPRREMNCIVKAPEQLSRQTDTDHVTSDHVTTAHILAPG